MKKSLPILIGTAIFLVCINYIYETFQWSEIVYILRSAKLQWLFAAGSLSILLFWLLRSLRWHVLLKALGVRIGFVELYFCTALSLTVSTLTPLQSGEILKIELLKGRNVMERSPGYRSFLLEKTLDVFVIAMIAVVGAVCRLYFHLDQASFWTILLISITLISLAVLYLLRMPARFATAGWLRRMLLIYDNRTLLIVTALTVCAWIIVAVGWQICLFSISLYLDLGKILFMVASLSIMNVLSFIPGALGVFEASTTQFLLHFGYGATVAQAGAIILRFQLLLVVALGTIHYIIWRYRKTRGGARRNRARG